MTTTQLDTILAQAIAVLEGNAAFLSTPGMLPIVQSLWADAKAMLPMLATATKLTPAQLASISAAGDQVVAGEVQLMGSGETASIIAAITALRGEPVMMWFLAERLSGSMAKLQDAPGY